MAILLALAAALSYGAADFMGGATSRRAGVLTVLTISYPVTVVVTSALALLIGSGVPDVMALLWGLVAGLAGGAGLITFYRALARGPMSVVAPISSLGAAVLAIAAGVSGGERLHPAAINGVLLCLAAIALVSIHVRAGGPTNPRMPDAHLLRRLAASGPPMAMVSGVGFGLFYVLLKESGSGDGLWPLAASRLGGLAVVLFACMSSGRRKTYALSRAVLAWAVLSGLLDTTANALYFLAVQEHQLSLVAVLTSLYPAVTVVLACCIHSERLRPMQWVGMVMAIAGVSLVTVG